MDEAQGVQPAGTGGGLHLHKAGTQAGGVGASSAALPFKEWCLWREGCRCLSRTQLLLFVLVHGATVWWCAAGASCTTSYRTPPYQLGVVNQHRLFETDQQMPEHGHA
jgi:hypothetical protein